MNNCQITLRYYNTDDGIWLTCTRHDDVENLGFDPTPEDVAAAARKHLDLH